MAVLLAVIAGVAIAGAVMRRTMGWSVPRIAAVFAVPGAVFGLLLIRTGGAGPAVVMLAAFVTATAGTLGAYLNMIARGRARERA